MSIVIPESNNKIRRNTVTAEFYDDEIKQAVLGQVEQQLIDVNDELQAEGIKRHFLFLLANDFYKDALDAETIAEIESYLPADYADQYEDLPE
ncbi:MAG: hypothetical protein GY920_17695 [Aliivibrio sp.]|nr:hypothetical protein [Aliivibrio sp.]